MKAWFGSLVPFFCSLAIHAQTPAAGKVTQSTGGICSPAVVAGSNVTITCSVLTADQQRLLTQMPALLQKIIRNQIEPALLLEKLDEIKKLQTAQLERVAPRRVSARQAEILSSGLLSFRGKKVQIQPGIDEEQKVFAEELKKALERAGLTVKFEFGVFQYPKGMWVGYEPSNQALAEAVSLGLVDAGILREQPATRASNWGRFDIMIRIGPRE